MATGTHQVGRARRHHIAKRLCRMKQPRRFQCGFAFHPPERRAGLFLAPMGLFLRGFYALGNTVHAIGGALSMIPRPAWSCVRPCYPRIVQSSPPIRRPGLEARTQAHTAPPTKQGAFFVPVFRPGDAGLPLPRWTVRGSRKARLSCAGLLTAYRPPPCLEAG